MNAAVSDLPPSEHPSPLWDDASLAQLRKELVRFADMHLRNREMAEDVAQEALASAIAASDRFERRASVKTWVFTILKNKIVDAMRSGWNKNRVDLIDEASDESDFDVLFTAKERWQPAEKPSSWGDPEQNFENQEFWAIFDICMNNLSEVNARVFTMREFLGFEAEEICKELGISTSNCWVILHRARMSLRLCLQSRWFEGGEEK